MAEEVHGFAEALGLLAAGAIDVVGHDLGTWIGYAYAAARPGDVRRLAVMDALLPGVTPPPAPGIPTAETNVNTWHFAFNRLDDLSEILVAGREREFLAWLFAAKSARAWRIGPADLDEYVRVLAAPGALRAARTLSMPVLALGAETGVGAMLADTMRLVADDVRGGTVAGCGHYTPEERPGTVAQALIRFLSGDAA